MLRNLVVALDEGAASTEARHLAFRLARKAGASVTGLAVVDRSVLAPAGPSAPGAGAFVAHRDATILADALARLDALSERFKAEAEAQGLEHRIERIEAPAEEALRGAAETSDLLVLGRDCDFTFFEQASLGPAVRAALHETPRPYILCPAEAPTGAEVIVAYDGSLAAMRALQVFTLLGIGQNASVSVLCVDERADRARATAGRAVRYLALHGIEAQTAAIEDDDRKDRLFREVAERAPALLVMGAYGRRGLVGRLLGTTTSRMIDHARSALFLQH